MELVVKCAAICTVATLLALVLRRNTPELALLLCVAAVSAVMGGAISLFEEIRALWEWMLSRSALEEELFVPLVKIAGISLITRLCSDVCQDGGQKALASLTEAVGSWCALACAAPLIRRALDVLIRLGG